MESLAAVKAHRFDRAALCWNVMLAPEALMETIKTGDGPAR